MTNIMKINSKTNLKSFLSKHGENSHIMLATIITHTSDIITNMIVSFMKNKAAVYKNIYFLIYFVDENDVKNIASNFPTKKDAYPYVVYMYNNEEELLHASAVTTLKVLRESFNVVEETYKDINDGITDSLTHQQTTNSILPAVKNVSPIVESNNQEEEDENFILEEKKKADKILAWIKIKKDYDNEYTSDIIRRKKIEEKIKNKDAKKRNSDKKNSDDDRKNKKNNNSTKKKK